MQSHWRLSDWSCKYIAVELCIATPFFNCLTSSNLLQMPTQFMMAILFCTCDGILNFQNIYYKYCSSRRLIPQQQHEEQGLQAETNELKALLETAGSGKHASPSGSDSDADSLPLKSVGPDSSTSAEVPPAHKLHSLSAGRNSTVT